MDVEVLPYRLVVIGGGYIGLEFASMFADFGSQVTVLQDNGDFLPREDEDVARAIRDTLEAQGIVLRFNAKTQKIEKGAQGPVVTFESGGAVERFEADAVLVATGACPIRRG